MNQNLNKKKIELFVDNGIDKYRRKEDISIKDMLQIFFENEGFFVLGDDKNLTIGYLDTIDIDQIKKIIEKVNKREIDYEKKTIKDLIKEKQIKFRDGFIDSNDSLGDVIERLNESEQIYFPVIKNNVLIGRVSKRILRGKIKDLY